ncbi:MAG: heparan-alpha-glucosaminide N-acetyltransferase domain-containing protein [Candidatus Nanopelagicales bacterium]
MTYAGPPQAPATPVAPARTSSSRIVGIDLARGLALLGMMATHVLLVDEPETGRLTLVGSVFAGRASALFALLAGVSLAIVTGGTTPYAGRDRARASVSIALRALIIGLLGLGLVELGAPVAVILAYYALLFVLALPFLGLRATPLAVLALAWALLSPVVSLVLRQPLEPGPGEQVGLEIMLTSPGEGLSRLLLTGYYPAFTWLAYVLAGLAVGRLDLREKAVALRVLVVGALLAVGSWLVSTALVAVVAAPDLGSELRAVLSPWELAGIVSDREGNGTTSVDDWRELLAMVRHSGSPFDLLHTIGSALVVLGLFLLVARSDVVRRLLRPLAAVGSMTLTLYTAHVVVLHLELGTWDDPGYYWAQVLAALVLAPLWLMRFRRGPLEQVVHAASHDIARALVPPRRTS